MTSVSGNTTEFPLLSKDNWTRELESCCANCRKAFQNDTEKFTTITGKYPNKGQTGYESYASEEQISPLVESMSCAENNMNHGLLLFSTGPVPSADGNSTDSQFGNRGEQMSSGFVGSNDTSYGTINTGEMITVLISDPHCQSLVRHGQGNVDADTAIVFAVTNLEGSPGTGTVLNDPVEYQEHPGTSVTVLEAMSTIFGFSLGDTNSWKLPFNENDPCALCHVCAQMLSSFYQAFQELQMLADESSYMSQGIAAIHQRVSGKSLPREVVKRIQKQKVGKRKRDKKSSSGGCTPSQFAETPFEGILTEAKDHTQNITNNLITDNNEVEVIQEPLVTQFEKIEENVNVIIEGEANDAKDNTEMPEEEISDVQCNVRKSKRLRKLDESKPHLHITSSQLEGEVDKLSQTRQFSLVQPHEEEHIYTVNNLQKDVDGKFICPDTTCNRTFKGLKTLNKHALNHKFDKSSANSNKYEKPNQSSANQPKNPTLKSKINTKIKKSKKYKSILSARKKYTEVKKARQMCEQCGREFLNINSFKKHVLSHEHEMQTTRCTVCDSTFSSISALSQHVRTVHEKAPTEYFCPKCDTPYQQLKDLKFHFETIHKYSLNICHICEKLFTSAKLLQEHFVRIHAQDNNLTQFLTTENSTLSDSTLKISNEVMNEFVLESFEPGEPEPEKASGSESHNANTLKCFKCNIEFKKKKQLDLHILFHNEAAPKFGCTQCPKKFFLAKGLQKHMSIHSGESSLTCTTCQKTFARQDHLKRHMELHNQIKSKRRKKILIEERNTSSDLRCLECSKIFTRREYLHLHMRIHTGERPFMCSACGKAFRDPRNLAQHLVTHKTDRPFCCSVCGLTFKRAHHLNDHEGTHRVNIARPFLCSIPCCGKAFKLRKHLLSHELVHSGSRDHSCHVCGKAFNRKDNLRQHITKVHGKDFVPTPIIIPLPQTNTTQAPVDTSGLENQLVLPSPIPSAGNETTSSSTLVDGDNNPIRIIHLVPTSEGTTLAAVSSTILQTTMSTNELNQYTYASVPDPYNLKPI